MNKLTKLAMKLSAAFLTLIAASTASTACFWGYYQPKEPKCLSEE
ncbi:lipoprotein [Clostridium polyendosporum]|uniref:Lipoprotein n=1 Tax=Clostridium polyendosporum TaxID=69208 RepID=A0A919VFW8_9CLOT|nr:cyclic lactone autoinducer peptide [Clostridium polyendosporum]GIM28592.1 lipoprotein [Clostridium polyendosporum]